MAEPKPEDLKLPKPEFRKTKLKIVQMTVRNPKTGEEKTIFPYVLDAELIANDKIVAFRESKKRPCKYRPWSFRNEFLKYYEVYESRFGCYDEKNKVIYCPICASENRIHADINPRIFYNYNYKVPYCWGSLTYHMIKEHYFEPPGSFIRNILSLSHYKFLKLDINDLNMFQGLVYAGSFKPRFKYIEKKEKDSEIYGEKEKAFYEYGGSFVTECIDENFCRLKNVNVIIDGREILRKDYTADRVYLTRADDYEGKKYTFHTHPMYYNVHYQFFNLRLALMSPSDGDIRWITYFKKTYGKQMEGHLVFAYEGTYYLTKKYKHIKVKDFNAANLYINNKNYKFYMSDLQIKYKEYIKTKNDYFEMAYKEQEFFHEMNQVLDKYNIRVVFFPRELTEKNKWEYGTFYIPYGVRKSKSRRYDDDNPRDELDRVSYLDGVNSVNDGVDFNDYDDESYYEDSDNESDYGSDNESDYGSDNESDYGSDNESNNGSDSE